MLFDFKRIIPQTKSEYPYMNEMATVAQQWSTRPVKTFENLDFWIERTPEAMAIINAIVTDIKADGFWFEGGKQAINKAEEFVKTNFFAEEYFQYLWDWIKYGDAYMWIGGVELGLKIQDKIEKFGIDEDFPRSIKTVPANTVDILHDGKKITGFKQEVSGKPRIFYGVKDIVHGRLIPNKGKVYGISPSQASLTEMNIIGYLKDYCGTFFKNGGVPDWAFILPNEMAGSPNHKKLINMLQKYKNPQMKHGNLVWAGEVKPHKIGTGLEDIDINSLAIYFTSVLALAHNMPVSRVAALIGAEVKVSSGGDDLANEGYWSKISEHQDRLETWFNTQLWEPYFNVEMHSNRAWKTNEIKEQQRNQFAIGNLKALNAELMRYDKQLNIKWIMRHIYLGDEDIEEVNKEFKQMQMDSMQGGMQPGGKPAGGKQPDKLEISRGAATEKHRDEKRKQVRPEQKLQMKKLTHEVNKELFFDKFQHWVKNSETRELYYYIVNGVLYATMSMPDENFKLTVAVSELDESQISEIKEFGELTQGVV